METFRKKSARKPSTKLDAHAANVFNEICVQRVIANNRPNGCLNNRGRFLGDSYQGARPGLSDRPISYLSKSVTSITLYNGDTILFSCSGIAMERQGCHLTRFLTSASLVRALNGTNEDHDDLKIEVRHEGNEVYMGVMSDFDLDRNFAVVNVHAFLDIQVGSFQHALQILPHGEILVVIGRSVSGEIIAKNVEFDGDSWVSEEDEDLDCKISEIEVLLNSQCREGTLQHYSLHYNVALVSVKNYPALRPSNTLLRWNKTFEVAAIGRCFKSGALMATSGDLVCWTGTLDCDFLATSTCKITKAGIGGPLVSLDGDVIGMNFYDKRIGTPFLGLNEIYEILASFETRVNLVKLAMTVIPLERRSGKWMKMSKLS
ncbi:hypothetical protein ACQ4PT_055077 [Festuca glaucescens]